MRQGPGEQIRTELSWELLELSHLNNNGYKDNLKKRTFCEFEDQIFTETLL